MLIVILSVFWVLGIIGCERSDKKEVCSHGKRDEVCVSEDKKEGNSLIEHTEHNGEHSIQRSVTITEESKNLIGLEIADVTYRSLGEVLRVNGKIAHDTEELYHIFSKTAGEVIEIRVRLGEIVKKGQILAVIYSIKPDSQENIVTPNEGIIVGENVSEGDRVDEMSSLFTIADLSKIWAIFNVYENDIQKVRIGQKIKVKSMAYSDKIFTGKITFVSPRVDEETRTIKVRAEIENEGFLLKFNMFVTGDIIISEKKPLTIPSKSILEFEEGDAVFVQTNDNEFELCKIEVGFQSEDGLSEVVKGLRYGQKVVTEGNFLLKSELLKSKLGAGCAE